MATQNSAITTNHIKAKIDKTQQNIKADYAVTEMKLSIT